MIVITAQTAVRISIAVASEGSDLWFATVILSLTHLSAPLRSILSILTKRMSSFLFTWPDESWFQQ